MVKFDSEMKEYIVEYLSSLNSSNIEGKELYIRVLKNALELAENQRQFDEILSFGNEYVSTNLDNIKRMPQFKYGLKTVMEKEMKKIKDNEVTLVPFVEEEQDPYEIFEKKDKIRVVMDALNEINPERRRIIEKVLIEGLSYRETAKECNCGHDTIRKNIDNGVFQIKMSFPVAYYRHYNSDYWTSILEQKEEKEKLKK